MEWCITSKLLNCKRNWREHLPQVILFISNIVTEPLNFLGISSLTIKLSCREKTFLLLPFIWNAVVDLEQGSHQPSSSDSQATDILDARAQAELKFLYVVSAQIYGEQQQGAKGPEGRQKAADISYLMKTWVFTFGLLLYSPQSSSTLNSTCILSNKGCLCRIFFATTGMILWGSPIFIKARRRLERRRSQSIIRNSWKPIQVGMTRWGFYEYWS